MPDKHIFELRKNLLDLEYAKCLQSYNTAVILLFTYLIGLALAFLSKQIDFTNIAQLIAIFTVSCLMGTSLVLIMLRYKSRLAKVVSEIKLL